MNRKTGYNCFNTKEVRMEDKVIEKLENDTDNLKNETGENLENDITETLEIDIKEKIEDDTEVNLKNDDKKTRLKIKLKVLIPIAIIVLMMLIALISFLALGKKDNTVDLSDNAKKLVIKEEGIVKTEKYNNLEFSNVSLTKNNDIYILSMDVKNMAKEKSKLTHVDIIVKDKKGSEIVTLSGYIGKELEPDEVTTVTSSTYADLSEAYTKEITERK